MQEAVNVMISRFMSSLAVLVMVIPNVDQISSLFLTLTLPFDHTRFMKLCVTSQERIMLMLLINQLYVFTNFKALLGEIIEGKKFMLDVFISLAFLGLHLKTLVLHFR